MKAIMRVLDFTLLLPVTAAGFWWTQIRCHFWIGQEMGARYGIWVNSRKTPQPQEPVEEQPHDH